MDDPRGRLDDIRSSDRQVQGEAYEAVIAATYEPVDWAYDIWDELLTDLGHPNNRVRSIAAQLRCNLAKSDPKARIVDDLPRLVRVTYDERFVTARHCLQSLWKIGVAGPVQREAYRAALAQRFADCHAEKNVSLIRTDILDSLGRVYRETGDASIATTADELIASEGDPKRRATCATAWRKATTS